VYLQREKPETRERKKSEIYIERENERRG